eukprot:TRINITY_DN67768_c10_g1_i3.p1 TRINITY_DN67768_c10_g1~~TRINITY_DN67768_c10_g1_i3.p1  ORF type:complete len:432 (+),score=58.48 TRINITY_DN67768_c10_g1_i3:30-1325(+)
MTQHSDYGSAPFDPKEEVQLADGRILTGNLCAEWLGTPVDAERTILMKLKSRYSIVFQIQVGPNNGLVVKRCVLKELPARSVEKWHHGVHSYHVEATFLHEFCPILRNLGLVVPQALDVCVEDTSNPDNSSDECLLDSKFGTVTVDLTCSGFKQKLFLSLQDTYNTLAWVASMHAQFYGDKTLLETAAKGKLWSLAGFWDLQKRDACDLDNIEAVWQDRCSVFSSVASETFSQEGVRCLATNLKKVARRAHEEMKRITKEHLTLAHGDFKCSNLFFKETPEGQQQATNETDLSDVKVDTSLVGVLDFQWSGCGTPAMDVMYLICCSMTPEALPCEEKLAHWYYNCLCEKFEAKNKTKLDLTWDDFWWDYNVCLVDYVRLVVGYIWKSITPETIKANAAKVGITPIGRSLPNVLWLINRAVRAVELVEKKLG